MHNLKSRLAAYRLLPVVTPVTVAGAVELAGALRAGGIRAIEITLRTDVALDALIAVKEAGIDIEVGAGTVTTVERAEKVAAIGVQFAVSPGVTPALLQAARELGLPLLPGVSGPSDIMLGIEYGREVFKLFPAAAVGGEALLKNPGRPFPRSVLLPHPRHRAGQCRGLSGPAKRGLHRRFLDGARRPGAGGKLAGHHRTQQAGQSTQGENAIFTLLPAAGRASKSMTGVNDFGGTSLYRGKL